MGISPPQHRVEEQSESTSYACPRALARAHLTLLLNSLARAQQIAMDSGPKNIVFYMLERRGEQDID